MCLININARSVCNKISDIEHVLELYEPDFLVLTETWLSEAILDFEVVPPAYRMIRKDRPTRGGGVAIVVKNTVEFSRLPNVEGTESVWIEVTSYIPPITLGAFYRPPNSDLQDIMHLSEYLHRLPRNKSLMVVGDFNAPHVDWQSMIPTTSACQLSDIMVNMCFSLNLTQVVSNATRCQGESSTILDLIFVRSDALLSGCECTVIDGISDHRAVIYKAYPDRKNEVIQRRTVLDFNRAQDESVLDFLEAKLDGFMDAVHLENADADCLWLKFTHIVNECIDKFVPTRVKKVRTANPWVTRELIHLKRKIKRLRLNKRLNLTENLRSLVFEFKTKMRQAKYDFHNVTLHNFMKENPSKFWRHISPANKAIDNLVVDETVVSNGREIAEAFNGYFSTMFTLENGILPHYPPSHLSGIPDFEVSDEGILNLLLRLDVKKATGPDGIPNIFLRRYAEWISKYLLVIFRKSLNSGLVPRQWKVAKVVPVHKKGSTIDVSNYRPVSLLCNCSKVFEHILVGHIANYLDNINFFTERQHGFRRGLSTVTQLLDFVHNLSISINNRGQTDVIFLDLSRAFDKVSHAKLLIKLREILKNEIIVRWLTDYLNLRQQYVEVQGDRSGLVPVTSGVPQGSVLGPLLFLLFINDMVRDISANVSMFADDCVIFSRISCRKDQDALNSALNAISSWCSSWQMDLNVQKCAVMTVSRQIDPLRYTYEIDGRAVNFVNSYTYLGINITNDLTWNSHIEKICRKASHKLWFLKRNLKYATPDTKLAAYKACVRPILEYASPVWDPFTATNIDKLETIQKRALRFIYSRYSPSSSITCMYELAGLDSLVRRRKINRLKFFYELVQGKYKINIDHYVERASHCRTRSHHLQFSTEIPRTDSFKYSFFSRTTSDWNCLPANAVHATSVNAFLAVVGDQL